MSARFRERRATPTTVSPDRIGTATYSSSAPTVALRRSDRATRPASASWTSGRLAWFSSRGELGAGDRGVAEHAPVARDHRDPGLDVARRRVDHGIEALRRNAPGELVLDDPGHQPRLGAERREALLAGPGGQPWPGQQEKDEEGEPGRHHRRRDHPSPE